MNRTYNCMFSHHPQFEKYRVIQDSLYESDFDKLMNDMKKNDAIH